ncbi:aldo/keto reductase [Nonomuraea jiangxiensis]|uniref:Predicted oxidoreductase n=1 Tax=Nonomuraea jiangxiensis TaxID=633440 RepID=A0A1G8CH77_9ACTN|nr:aldo/keto reductase [Nonomuraea jiangxiensis]SDH44583.1 Predicted oxidoreductase [Nonomuraea jiangxiensis]
MDHLNLGHSGLRVSRACLGTMNFGTEYGLAAGDEAEAGRVIDAFLEAGGNFIDTADLYHRGETEEILGRALKGRREWVVLATKGAMPVGPEGRGLSRRHLTRALDASLRRLGTDYIDLYQCHQWDPLTPIDEVMATLDAFVRAGKVRYLGCSNFTATQIVESQWAAERVGGTPFVSLQPQYSLVQRVIEAEILPACERHGMGTVVYGTLGGGVLTGRYRHGEIPDPDSRMGRLLGQSVPAANRWARSLLNDRNLAIAEELVKVAAELGAAPAEVALAWVAGRPGVTSVLIGPRSVEQLRGNLAAFELELPREVTARLDEISHLDLGPMDGSFFHLVPR